MGFVGRGMLADLRARAPLYLDDWKAGLHWRVLASIFFMYFASIGPAVTFSSQLDRATDGNVGASEVILSTAISGIPFSPLCQLCFQVSFSVYLVASL